MQFSPSKTLKRLCCVSLFFSFVIPVSAQEIFVVDDGAATPLTDGQSAVVDFGCTLPDVPVSRSFTVSNTDAANLVLPANGLTLPAGYTLNPGWETALVTPEIRVTVFKPDASASGDSESIKVDLVNIPSIISVDDVTISIPEIPPSGGNVPSAQFPYIDSDDDILISTISTTQLDTDPVSTGPNSWKCSPTGTQSNPNGDICTEFTDQVDQGMSTNRFRTALIRLTRGVLTGTLDNPAANGELVFGFALKQLNTPFLPPGEQNDGDAYGTGGVDVIITLYNSQTDTTDVLVGKFQDDGLDNDRSEVTLFGTPVEVPVPIILGNGADYTFSVDLNSPADGIFSGNWSLETNDADENPFNFPITGIVDGTAPTLTGLPSDILEPSVGATCSATVTWTPPTPADNLDPAPTISQTKGLAPGSTFPVGMHEIEYTAVDCAGNTFSDSFFVNVSDLNPPTLVGSLPKRIIANTAPGQTSVIVDFPALTAFDDCDPNPAVVCTPPSGSTFGLGLTQVCCVATDSSGNMSAQQCFEVIVIEAQPIGAERSFELTVQRNDAAPGVSGATFLTINRAFLNEGGSIAIEATLLGAGTNNVGVWKDTGTGFGLVAQKGSVAPGTGGTILSFDDVILSDSNAISFESRLSGTPTTSNVAHFNDAGGALGSSAQKGTTIPASTGVFSILQEPAFDGLGNSFTPATLLLGTGGVSVANDSGIWSKPAASPLIQVGREGDPVGAAIPGVNFGQFAGRVVANSAGQVAFYSFLEFSGGVTTADNTAIFSGTPGALTIVSREGDIAPGPDPAVFQTFAAESINNLGKVAFEANLGTGGGGSTVSSINNSGLFTNSNGIVELVAREGDLAPCLGATAGDFSSFRDIFIADNGDVYFQVYLTGGGVNSANDGSFWRWQATDGTLHPVLREGDTAPSTQGAVIATLLGFAVSDDGIHAVTGTLVPGIGDGLLNNNYGLWMDDGSNGLPILLAREGDKVDLGLATATIPRITFASFDKTTNSAGGSGGHGKVLNDAGDIIVKASFNQNSSGVFVIPGTP
jgi:hypothetical protein